MSPIGKASLLNLASRLDTNRRILADALLIVDKSDAPTVKRIVDELDRAGKSLRRIADPKPVDTPQQHARHRFPAAPVDFSKGWTADENGKLIEATVAKA